MYKSGPHNCVESPSAPGTYWGNHAGLLLSCDRVQAGVQKEETRGRFRVGQVVTGNDRVGVGVGWEY